MHVHEGKTPTLSAHGARRWRRIALASLALALVPAAPAGAELSTTPDPTWGTNGRVYDVLRVGGRVYLAGSFTSVTSPGGDRTVARSRLAAFDAATGALVEGWAPSPAGEVRTLAASSDGRTVYFGGSFSGVSGKGRLRAAAVDAATGALLPWRADANSTVQALAVVGSTVYLGGDFATLGGQARSRLAAVDAATGALRPWAPSANGQVRALEASSDGTRVYAGGKFTTVSGQARNKIAAISASTGEVASWLADAQYDVIDLDSSSSAVFAAVAGPGGRASAFDAATGRRLWTKFADGDVQAVAFAQGRVYAGGHFYKWGSDAAHGRFATLNPTNGAFVDAFRPTVSLGNSGGLGVWAISGTSTSLHLGGDFTVVSGLSRLRYAQFR